MRRSSLYSLFLSLRTAANRLAWCGFSTAAILCEVPKQRVHGVVARCVDERPPLAHERHEVCVPQPIEVERQRVGRNSHSIGDLAGRDAARSCLHEQPVDLQPMFLSKRSKRRYDVCFVHVSTTIEI